MEYTIIGSGVNLAARLETACDPNEILISYETHAHVKDQVHCEKKGHITVKGISHPVTTYRVVDLYENLEEDHRIIRSRLPHFFLEADIGQMSAEEQRDAAITMARLNDRLSSKKVEH